MKKEFMEQAILEAKKGERKGQTPFGAAIVKNGKVVSKAHNTVWKDTDVTAHAEINAIRKACKKLKTIDLSGCEIYSTTEPCPMCLSAIHWAKIQKVYFGAGIKDADNAGFNEIPISNKKMIKEGKMKIKIENMMKKECKKLFDEFNGKTY